MAGIAARSEPDDLHAALDAGQLSSAELTGYYLDRIERLGRGGQLGAVISVSADAVEQAAAADVARESGQAAVPLAGIPVLAKDNMSQAGVPDRASTASSSRAACRRQPEQRIPANFAGAAAVARRVRRTGDRSRLPATWGRVTAGEPFRGPGGREVGRGGEDLRVCGLNIPGLRPGVLHDGGREQDAVERASHPVFGPPAAQDSLLAHLQPGLAQPLRAERDRLQT